MRGVIRRYLDRAFRRAARHGSPFAYLYIAQLDEDETAGPPDLFEAYVGYSIALAWLQDHGGAAKTTDDVSKRRHDVAVKLTAAQMRKADSFVQEHKGDVH